MANANVTHIGQANGSGSNDALFRDIWTGEVLTSFNQNQVTMDKHMVRNITNGNSATFYATGKVSGGYHVPGTEIAGGTSVQNKLQISVDDILYTANFFAEIEELKSAFDARGEITKQQGQFLANAFDTNVLRTALKAARTTSPNVVGGPTGLTLVNANSRTDSAELVKTIFAARTQFEERSIPWAQSGCNTFIRPAQYSLLTQNTNVLNKLWGGEGSYSQGEIAMVAGIPLVSTVNLPNTDLSTDAAITASGFDPAAILAKYRGNYSNTVALLMCKEAVGTVKLRDLVTEVNYDERRFGTLVTSRFAVGHGVLRPECAIEIATA